MCRDLVQGVPLDVTQHPGHTQRWRDVTERRVDLREHGLRERIGPWIDGVYEQHVVPSLVKAETPEQASPPQASVYLVYRDATQPCSEPPRVLELTQVGEGRDESVLHDVLSLRAASQEPGDAGVNRGSVAHVQRVLRRSLSRSSGSYQGPVVRELSARSGQRDHLRG